MPDRKTYTGYSKKVVSVPAGSVTSVDYLDTKPNYFRVQNQGTSAVYCSTANMPTTKIYDFMVSGGGLKAYAEPTNRTRLFIYNPNNTPVDCVVVSFAADFEPLAMVMSELEIEIPKNVEMNGFITGFGTALPTGNNKIGKVDLASFPDLQYNGKTYSFWQTFLNTCEFTKKLANLAVVHGLCVSGNSNKTITATTGYEICEVAFLSNDSETDNLTVSVFCATLNHNTSMVLKPGEVLNNVKFRASSLTITATDAYRICYNEMPLYSDL